MRDPHSLRAITAIEPVRGNPTMRRVRVGRTTIVTLRAADVEALGLTVGTEWTEQVAQSVDNAVEKHQARKSAIRLLSRRAYSRGELIDRLARKGHDDQIAKDIADELAEVGLIDDETYAGAVARAAIAAKPASPKFLAKKLQARRISPDLAQRIARETLADVDLVDAAARFARRRLQMMTTLSRPTVARRIAAALTRRGFDTDTIAATLDRLALARDEHADSSPHEAPAQEFDS